LHQLAGSASSLRRQVVELLFQFGGEMDFHRFQPRDCRGLVSNAAGCCCCPLIPGGAAGPEKGSCCCGLPIAGPVSSIRKLKISAYESYLAPGDWRFIAACPSG